MRPILIITMGCPGSGKTTYCVKKYSNDFDIIDVDLVKESNSIENVSTALKICKERSISNFKNKNSFVWVSTSKNRNSLISKIKQADDYNFDVHLLYFDTPINVCYRNVIKRSRKSNRVVLSKNIIERFNEQILKNISYLNNNNYFQKYKFTKINLTMGKKKTYKDFASHPAIDACSIARQSVKDGVHRMGTVIGGIKDNTHMHSENISLSSKAFLFELYNLGFEVIKRKDD